MSETLKERLRSHSEAFEGLLSLIPAKYYYENETAGQWKRKKPTKEEKAKHKRAKLDGEVPASALDEAKQRSLVPDGEESDSEVSVIFDDTGNELVVGPRRHIQEEEVALPLKAEASKSVDAARAADSGEKADAAAACAADTGVGHSTVKPNALKNGKPEKGSSKPAQNSEPKQPEAPKATSDPVPASDKPEEDARARAEKQARVQELRDKLAERIQEMREKRKAPGTLVTGAPKNRDELLVARKQRQEQRKLKKKQEKQLAKQQESAQKANNDSSGESDAEEEPDQIAYGKVEFGNGERLGNNLELEEAKKLTKRNAIDQLKVMESRKAKLATLDPEKQKQVAENSQWSRAILQSQGAKVRDDEKLLRKTVKQKQRQKLKSGQEWNSRQDKVAKGIAQREAKRNANLEQRKENKRLGIKANKKGASKKGSGKKRAGFEGKRRK